MISKLAIAKTDRKIQKSDVSENMLINWRHYHSSASTRTLYDNGMTTAFPYAYGTIPVPFDCYVSSVTFTANKYSSYGTPTGTSSTVYVYKGLNTLVTSQALTYTPSQGMQLTHDLGISAAINKGEKISIRWYTNGIWRYMNSTIILTKR